jgi:hypothetical protein
VLITTELVLTSLYSVCGPFGTLVSGMNVLIRDGGGRSAKSKGVYIWEEVYTFFAPCGRSDSSDNIRDCARGSRKVGNGSDTLDLVGNGYFPLVGSLEFRMHV